MTSRYLLRRMTDSIWHPTTNTSTYTYRSICTCCYRKYKDYLLAYYDIYPMKSLGGLRCDLVECNNPASHWVFLDKENRVRVGRRPYIY